MKQIYKTITTGTKTGKYLLPEQDKIFNSTNSMWNSFGTTETELEIDMEYQELEDNDFIDNYLEGGANV